MSSCLPPLPHRRLWMILGFVLVATVIVTSLMPGGDSDQGARRSTSWRTRSRTWC